LSYQPTSTGLPLADGVLVVVKDDCETCHLTVPVLEQLNRESGRMVVVSQDREGFPSGLEVVYDRDLEISWMLGTETTPTIYRIEGGEVVNQQSGWLRSGWEQVTGVKGLGPGLPGRRPGCGSDTMLPQNRQRLVQRHSPHRLTSPRAPLRGSQDPTPAAFPRGWPDGQPAKGSGDCDAHWCWEGPQKGGERVSQEQKGRRDHHQQEMLHHVDGKKLATENSNWGE